ncbi:hypothetical protein L227DRAFT_55326 [Lentinus tigrinus ALCF2SS1-6]|uniref:Uncharacterized protein n=1 Tax=Lentinus tigrinus ALCF2SS1-6 TaxID=1328759 RepID=A0A5C2SED2_9APHY|nr:hypothetical protein L227DRAFT_55326 [Lentinus tigrinus ALCF2SS1-6]
MHHGTRHKTMNNMFSFRRIHLRANFGTPCSDRAWNVSVSRPWRATWHWHWTMVLGPRVLWHALPWC